MYEIIVVDDDRANTQLIQLILEMDGYGVQICPTIAHALQSSTAETAAFIIDYHLAGGKTGDDLVTLIRRGETPAPADTTIVVTSGDRRVHDRVLEAGADRFIQKPYSPSDLSALLQQLIATGKGTE
jgi:CheY-like chemotaxis protein